jgi:hypothetical protein
VSEWWTYRLNSFLMFSPRTYARLLEQANADLWPLQPLAVALGLAALGLAWRARSRVPRRLVWLLLAGAWLWVAWAFLHQRFMAINWAAEYAAWAWVAQGVALAWWGGVRGRLGWRFDAGEIEHRSPRSGVARAAGAVVALVALLAWPLLGRLSGGSWAAAESFAVMPVPTALAVRGAGAFLCAGRRPGVDAAGAAGRAGTGTGGWRPGLRLVLPAGAAGGGRAMMAAPCPPAPFLRFPGCAR